MQPMSSSKKYSYTKHPVISPGRKEIQISKTCSKHFSEFQIFESLKKSEALHEQEPGVGKVCWSRAALTGISQGSFPTSLNRCPQCTHSFQYLLFSFLKELFILTPNTHKGLQILNGDNN